MPDRPTIQIPTPNVPDGATAPESSVGSAVSARLERVRALVLAHGWNATCYQIINPGIDHWFDPKGDAVVGYVRSKGVHVVAGAPVCERARLAAVVTAFERHAASQGDHVCFFGAEERLETLTRDDPGHSRVLLGAQPVWDPRQWDAVIAARGSLRAQLNRARNKSVRIEEWPAARASGDARLRAVLLGWLAGRGLPPLHFLVEPETLARLFDRRVYVALRSETVVGFSIVSPIPRRNGWLVEQVVRAPLAPNGTTELLVDAVMRGVGADGAELVTLGLSPLSRHVEDPTKPPFWLRALLGWTREHGRRFYNFEGLDRFKAKFGPHRWDPVYAIANERRISPRTMYAIATAFSGGSPLALLARGIVRALSTKPTRRAVTP